VKFKVKGGRERTLSLPNDVRRAIKEYLKLDEKRRRNLHSGDEDAYLFQPLVNYRTLELIRQSPFPTDGQEYCGAVGRAPSAG